MENPAQFEHITVPQEKKGDKFSKYLFSLIVFLLMVALILLSYFFYTKFVDKPDNCNETVPQSTEAISKVSNTTRQYKKDIEIEKLENFFKKVRYFSQYSEVVEEIKYSQVISGKFQGITEYNQETGEKSISLLSVENNEVVYLLSKEAFENLSVYLVTHTGTFTKDFSEIITGDFVTITHSVNLLAKKDNQENVVIRIIRN